MSEPSRQGSISTTLLSRLRRQDAAAWDRVTLMFGPLVYGWCRQAGLKNEDARDVVQEVFVAAFRGLGSFRRDRLGDSFCGWLATITRRRILNHLTRPPTRAESCGGSVFNDQVHQLPDPNAESILSGGDGSPVAFAEKCRVVRRAASLLQSEFEDRTWRAFWATAVDGRAAADVAEELGMSLAAVYKAKSRVLARLRQDLDGLLE